MRRQDVPNELLQDVKNNLNITWNDEATDTNIRGLIASGTVFLDSKGGTEFDYEADGMPRTLLMEYVRYARDAALDVFENNYLSMILAMQNGRTVTIYLEGTGKT